MRGIESIQYSHDVSCAKDRVLSDSRTRLTGCPPLTLITVPCPNEARTTEAARRWRSARAPDTLSSTRPADPWTRDGRNKPAQRVTTPRRDLVDARSQLRANDKHGGWPNALARFRTPVGKKGFTPPIPWRPPSRPRPKGHPRKLPRPRWPQNSRPAPSGPHALRLSRRTAVRPHRAPAAPLRPPP